MSEYYADSSVLIKRHIHEMGSAWFQALADPSVDHLFLTSRVSMVEVYSALNRRVREAHLDLIEYAEIINDFAALCDSEYEMIELTDEVTEHARQLLERHSLRAYDAIQLASALIVNDELQVTGLPPLTFLSADDRLSAAALAEGLMADNPNRYP